MTFDAEKFRATMRLWATGVTVVSAQYNDIMRGITASSFTSVTLDPPLMLVCIQKKVECAQVIRDSGYFSISMLGEEQEEISNLFAGFVDIPEDDNRFNHVKVTYATTGSPIIADAMGWLDCRLHETYDGSTHYIFIGEVLEASGQGPEVKSPLLYYNRTYHRLA